MSLQALIAATKQAMRQQNYQGQDQLSSDDDDQGRVYTFRPSAAPRKPTTKMVPPKSRRKTPKKRRSNSAVTVLGGGASEGRDRWTTRRTIRFAFNGDDQVHDIQLSRTPGQGTRSWQKDLDIPTADTVRGIKHIYRPQSIDKKPVPLAYQCSQCGKILWFDAPLAPSSYYVLGRNHLTRQHREKAHKILDDTKPQGPILSRATNHYPKKQG